jgi:dephospho-CoA kinase
MIVVGLTGSIGMGKSTTARMFRDAGVPVHDSDETVHRLYAGKAAPLIEEAFPGTVRDGAVDRAQLAAQVLGRPGAMKKLEAIIHPLVRAAAAA